ncbi:hypothetical protein SNE40_017898 [Patella caerulea]|uniref:Dual specificity protein phosphatase n=1 Tax=Patella caerulea TaxID=87958 RepID=A0AAN8JHX6_PATCE
MTNYNRYYNHELYDKVHNYLSSKENKPSTPSHVSFLGFQYFDLPPAPKHKYDEVHPRIFLGDGVVAQDKDQLTSMGITHLVNCCEGTKFNQVNTNQAYYDDINIKYHGIQAQDVASFRICDHFEAAVHFIDDALKEGKYVICSISF